MNNVAVKTTEWFHIGSRGSRVFAPPTECESKKMHPGGVRQNIEQIGGCTPPGRWKTATLLVNML